MNDAQRGGFRHYLAMVTLTYAPDVEWHPYHITEFQKRLRAWLKYRGFGYRNVWVSELQKRGIPHYHIAIWVPHGLRLPKPDRNGWWPHGMSNVEGVKKPFGYLTKYLSKGQDTIHKFPKGMRTHGSGGLSKEAQLERRWWLAPKYVRDRWPSIEDDVVRAQGGGWVSRKHGDWMPSPWELVSFGIGGVTVRWRGCPEWEQFYMSQRGYDYADGVYFRRGNNPFAGTMMVS